MMVKLSLVNESRPLLLEGNECDHSIVIVERNQQYPRKGELRDRNGNTREDREL